MFGEKYSPFTSMFLGALGGIMLGIIFGLIFGLIIAIIAIQFGTAMMMNGPLADYQFPAFLGMGAGAIIGAILGGTSANKK